MSARIRAVLATGLVAGLVVVVSPGSAFAADFTVTTTADTPDANPGDGICDDLLENCSLRAAIQEANASAGADTITVAGGATYVLALPGGGEDAAATGDLDVTGEIDIITDGGQATVSGNGLGDRLFDVKTGATLRVTDLGLILGTAQLDPMGSGGAVLNGGSFTATDTEIVRNLANRAGGGIEATAGSTTTLTRVLLQANQAGPTPGNGGGLHLTGAGTVVVSDSVVSDNVAGNEGGGLWNSAAGSLTVTDTDITNNTVDGSGPGGLTFVDPDFEGGGGIHNDGAGGTVTVTGGSITGNTVALEPNQMGSGGGILNVLGTVTVTGTEISGNSADRAGGGIENQAGTVTLTAVDLSSNTVDPNPGNGGGLHTTGAGTVTVTDSTVSDNASVEGGGLWNSAVGTLTVINTDLIANTASGAAADQGGGAIYNETNGMGVGGTVTVTGGVVAGNQATGASGSGGGILNNGGSLTLSDVAVSENFSSRAGGGIEAVGGTTSLTEVALTDNATGPAPGNGGGLHLTGAGTVTVALSEVNGNVAANEGGGLWNSAVGTMTVTQTRLLDNVADGFTEGSGGGGLYNDGGTLNVANTVVANNSASIGGGVLDANDGDTSLTHVTVTANQAETGSGAQDLGGDTITVANSIIAGNIGGSDCAGNVVSSGGNVFGDCANATADDQAGVVDPLLDASFVPLAGSPALDAGLPANGLPVDLVGNPRPSGPGFDSGALERQVDGPVDTTTSTTTTTTPPVDTTPTTSTPDATIPPDSTTTSTTVPNVTSTTVPGSPSTSIPDGTTPTGPVDPGTPTVPGPDTIPPTPGDTVPGGVAPGGIAPGGGVAGGGVGSLPRTGSDTDTLRQLGFGLILVGGALLVLRRRAGSLGGVS